MLDPMRTPEMLLSPGVRHRRCGLGPEAVETGRNPDRPRLAARVLIPERNANQNASS